jgi:hypothetical protein
MHTWVTEERGRQWELNEELANHLPYAQGVATINEA